MVQLYRLSRNPGESLHVAQNSAFKNHPRVILRDENHLYGIVLVHINNKTLTGGWIQNFKQSPKLGMNLD